MKLINKLFYLLFLLMVLIGYQNCGIGSSLESTKSVTTLNQSGNGGGYEGKPDGRYYHYIPNYTCEGQASAEQITEIKGQEAYLYQSTSQQCADQSSPERIEDIIHSPFQNEFIGVKDSLFKRYDSQPEGIPSSLAEVLCRDDFENPTFEIVSHFDREKNEALTRVYSFQGETSDFSVSRILSSDKVQYVSDTLRYSIDFSKPILPEKKFSGQILKSSVNNVSPQPLTCIVGGSLDTSKWSLKALTNRDAGPFHLLRTGAILFVSEVSRFYYSSTLFRAKTHFFKIGLDEQLSNFSTEVLGEDYNIDYRVPTEDDSLSIFSAELSTEIWPSMYVYDWNRLRVKKLTNLTSGNDPEAYFLRAPTLTSEDYLFYDTKIIDFYSSRNKVVVRGYDLKTDQITEIKVLDPHNSSGYSVLKQSNKLLLFWTVKDNTPNAIEIYDPKSKSFFDMPIQLPDNCFLNGHSIIPTKDESSIVTSFNCGDSNNSVVQISLIDGSVKLIAQDSFILWRSEGSEWIVIADNDNNRIAYNISDERLFQIPIDPRHGHKTSAGNNYSSTATVPAKIAISHNRNLFGFGGPEENPVLYQVDLNSGKIHNPCQTAIGKKLFVGVLPNQNVFLFTYDSNLKVYHFYQVTGDLACQRLNEFPSEFPIVKKLFSTDIGFGILLGNPLTRSSAINTPEAIFVPVDGRPPLKFNKNTKSNWSMEISADKNRIILRGPNEKGLSTIFSFDL